jgi:hypothetical protein
VVFWHIKKFGQKISAYVSTFYVLTKSFHEKPTYFVLCVKRQNLVLKNSFVRVNFFLSFLHKPQKKKGFSLACTHIECWDVSAKFLFKTFWHFEMLFSDGRSICSHVPNWISVFLVLLLQACNTICWIWSFEHIGYFSSNTFRDLYLLSFLFFSSVLVLVVVWNFGWEYWKNGGGYFYEGG